MLALLRLLQDGHFHSGAALGEALGISRSAVWKQLQRAEVECGLTLHRVRGKGYRLAQPLSLLDKPRLQSACEALAWDFHLLHETDSTNARAMRLLEAGNPAPCLLLAESQSAGRGRRGRHWVSPFAENLYYSLALRLDGAAQPIEALSLTAGLALLKTLHETGLTRAGLKWPNDVLVDDRKIAGILLELSGDPSAVCHLVIGIGINVNRRVEAVGIDQPWTSLFLELGHLCDRTELAIRLSEHLRDYLQIHFAKGFSALREQWEAHHLWQGKSAVLISGAGQITGKVLGVDERGALRLQTAAGEQRFSAGELSLRLAHDS
ncbi:biotin--protein ligase [Ventosimonas gracilis]|uniref:Bifunctional ligase/repressor BirA n=1 Tax=Ventosimonas gracilis TaxID=1680762 RepID=A0A139SVP4_9GAMM|nr:bifunctional biotin--[acetyl-CoA-carboxylase] ligase/biotin operon repressor BirA [Ventosimonas gracilis]KXU38686.1 biotin--protein ligase [Ventosimonas gracilis]